jgi:hypothetical protein
VVIVGVSVRLIAALLLLTAISQAQTSPRSTESGSSQKATRSTFGGDVKDGAYRNSHFGFTCKIPDGWTVQTKEFAEGAPESPATHLLLSVLKHSPGSPDSSVNSAIVITAEDQTLYPDMVEAADYFVPLTDFTKSKGFEVIQKPYPVKIGDEDLDRADFRKDLGHLSMYQSTLVTIERDYVLSFTFIGGSEEEITGLAGGLSFDNQRSTPAKKPAAK